MAPDIQVRSQSFSAFSPESFVHVQARIWCGRTPAQKHALSTLIGEKLTIACKEASSMTVEIIDIDKSSYFKRRL